MSYTKKTHEDTIGSLELSVKDKETVNVPACTGVGAIVVGGSYCWSPRRARGLRSLYSPSSSTAVAGVTPSLGSRALRFLHELGQKVRGPLDVVFAQPQAVSTPHQIVTELKAAVA